MGQQGGLSLHLYITSLTGLETVCRHLDTEKCCVVGEKELRFSAERINAKKKETVHKSSANYLLEYCRCACVERMFTLKQTGV